MKRKQKGTEQTQAGSKKRAGRGTDTDKVKRGGAVAAKKKRGGAAAGKKRKRNEGRSSGQQGRVQPEWRKDEDQMRVDEMLDAGIAQRSFWFIFGDWFEIIIDGINMWHLWGVDDVWSICVFDFGILFDDRHIGFNVTFMNLLVGVNIGWYEEDDDVE